MSASRSATVRRLTAAGAATAALLGATALPATAADHTHRTHRHAVVISGVHLNPEHRAHREHRNRLDHRAILSLNREWVAISNRSRRAVDLDGWTLSDRHGHTYTFRHYRLDGGATVRVHSGYGRDTRTDLFQDRRSSVWDRHGDTAVLRDDRHRFVDALTWGGPH
ncbi:MULTISPECIES: lamin tail domain-containing protein [Streptomyces]|uniref:Lamin tail domain-containing protein n=1 Tax=Streptomyces thermoviolaceus subsp. thermoviolaceus TaxID=66860 RepID=A0ABX0YU53_STRTL|nr:MULTISPECIES: lamin tail domain-containing protein [Streptomyces]NJP15434.1 lamin tail domain-containing protein [Streptomyces thermoviolaceus subsp. thermoviolaceus]WTD48671.1 lamin tail domain-containing protein [Streptomyces thermoviolaceus]GGV69785.1 hypothetical protein GCM10010499_18770 [Streptomyces thermoviolaceus subsp. apingens]GHB04739.1 hypothetical protein GCM10010512_40280 [Streptomyces thermoviolaceus subsp. thermoviolaceus]